MIVTEKARTQVEPAEVLGDGEPIVFDKSPPPLTLGFAVQIIWPRASSRVAQNIPVMERPCLLDNGSCHSWQMSLFIRVCRLNISFLNFGDEFGRRARPGRYIASGSLWSVIISMFDCS